MSAQADKTPSSGAARHLLPRWEKEGSERVTPPVSPSPLAGEGARRAGEGGDASGPSRLKTFARRMRHQPTDAERKLWQLLRNRRFAAFKFRRQEPIDHYIVDFVCYSARFVIEADGSQHTENSRDAIRDAYLRAQGFHLLRLWNNDILARPGAVSDAIWAAVQGTAHE